MASRVRSLTAYQAVQCEQALEDRCRCRCGGAYHGAKRPGLSFDPEAYYLLPDDDPHHAEPSEKGWQLAFLECNGVGVVQRLLTVAGDTSPLGSLSDAHVRSAEVVQPE